MENVLSNKEHFKQDWIKQANTITGIDKDKLESIFNNHYKDGYIELLNSVYFSTINYNAVDFYYNSQDNLILNELRKHEDHHMVKPKMVYISNTTEIGTVYTKNELEAISKVCKDNNLYLYLDGARLASALASEKCDINLED